MSKLRQALRRLRPRWVAASLLLVLLAVGLAHVPMEWITTLYFYPFSERAESPAELGRAVEEVELTARDGTPLDAFWLLPTGSETRGVVVQAHGNAGNLSHHWPLVSGLAEGGFRVLCFDYRGFGGSGGRPSRTSAAQDLRSALDLASDLADAQGLPLHVVGQSIGAAVALDVVPGRDDVDGLVLDSPFSSWPGIAAHHLAGDAFHRPLVESVLRLALRQSPPDPADTVERLGDVPLLVISGTADEVCPPAMAAEIARGGGTGRVEHLVLEESPHVGLRSPELQRRVDEGTLRFLRGVGAPGAS